MSRPRTLTDEERHKRRLEAIKAWKKKNPEKVAEQQKRYSIKHKEQLRIYDHNRYKTMKEKAAKYDELMGGKA